MTKEETDSRAKTVALLDMCKALIEMQAAALNPLQLGLRRASDSYDAARRAYLPATDPDERREYEFRGEICVGSTLHSVKDWMTVHVSGSGTIAARAEGIVMVGEWRKKAR